VTLSRIITFTFPISTKCKSFDNPKNALQCSNKGNYTNNYYVVFNVRKNAYADFVCSRRSFIVFAVSFILKSLERDSLRNYVRLLVNDEKSRRKMLLLHKMRSLRSGLVYELVARDLNGLFVNSSTYTTTYNRLLSMLGSTSVCDFLAVYAISSWRTSSRTYIFL